MFVVEFEICLLECQALVKADYSTQLKTALLVRQHNANAMCLLHNSNKIISSHLNAATIEYLINIEKIFSYN